MGKRVCGFQVVFTIKRPRHSAKCVKRCTTTFCLLNGHKVNKALHTRQC